MIGEAQKETEHGTFNFQGDTSTNEIIDTRWMAKIFLHLAKQLEKVKPNFLLLSMPNSTHSENDR